jgi:hypothetical protein
LCARQDGTTPGPFDRFAKSTGETEDFAFAAALGLVISRAEGWERAAREFLGTKHRLRPYIAMMLYSRMFREAAREANQIIQRRWKDAEPENWSTRLREGDENFFREMLIGYYLRHVGRNKISTTSRTNGDLKHQTCTIYRTPGRRCFARLTSMIRFWP